MRERSYIVRLPCVRNPQDVPKGRNPDNPRRKPGGGVSLCVAPTGRDISRRVYFSAWQVMVSRPVGAEREADACPPADAGGYQGIAPCRAWNIGKLA
jgi:hypothetical protein